MTYEFKDLLADTFSLFGHSRQTAAASRYNNICNKYNDLHLETVKLDNHRQLLIHKLGQETKEAMATVRRSSKILSIDSKMHVSVNKTDSKQMIYGHNKALELANRVDAIESAAGGAVVGGVAAVGSWSLISLVGSASTGTAIASLSGAAATNATLAWFGGGALAAGGAGMAGGALVLGSFIAIPLIAFSSITTHLKANELNRQIPVVEQKYEELQQVYESLDIACKVGSEQFVRITQAHQRLQRVQRKVASVLYPYGIFSIIWIQILQFFGKHVQTAKERKLLDILDKELERFTRMFTTSPNETEMHQATQAPPAQLQHQKKCNGCSYSNTSKSIYCRQCGVLL